MCLTAVCHELKLSCARGMYTNTQAPRSGTTSPKIHRFIKLRSQHEFPTLLRDSMDLEAVTGEAVNFSAPATLLERKDVD
jgi:hypothetical protein